MLRSHPVWFIGLGLTLLGFGLGTTKANAQTQYGFEVTYQSETTLQPLAENIFQINSLAKNPNATYGLTNLTNINYGKLDPNTGVITFGPDPTTFGLNNLPGGGVTISGSGIDKLFGTINGSGLLDFVNLTANISGTINITGGEGRFKGANGTFTFLDTGTLSSDPNAPVRTQAFVRGSFQTVPEPSQITALLGIGVVAATFLGRRRSQQSLGKQANIV